MKTVCKECHSTAGTKRSVRGSILIEIILWLCFIIPGLIYSIWRHTTAKQVCKSCGGDVISVNSPLGRKLSGLEEAEAKIIKDAEIESAKKAAIKNADRKRRVGSAVEVDYMA